MTNQLEIDKAIQAHMHWTAQLRDAVRTCSCATPLDTLRSDDQCQFGQWLYSNALTPAEKSSPRFKIVQKLHAEFHRTAARVAELAQSGRQDEANAMLMDNADYSAISRKLIHAMEDWKKIFRQ